MTDIDLLNATRAGVEAQLGSALLAATGQPAVPAPFVPVAA